MTHFDLNVDAIGLHCPLPLLRLKRALTEIQSGEIIRILATDPAAYLDIGVFTEQSGHTIEGHYSEKKVQYFFIRKA